MTRPPRSRYSGDPEEGGAPALDQADPEPLEDAVEDAVEHLLEEVGVETLPQPALQADDLRGRVAVVTGASSGIGRAVAIEFARRGVHVAFNFLDTGDEARAEAAEVSRLLRECEVQVFCQACDVRDHAQVNAFIGEATERLGGVHILVNNAGVGRDRALWRMTDQEWRTVLETNLYGTFYCTRAVAPYMRAQEWGKIVNVASVHGFRSEFGISNYAASKAAIISFTRASALELGSRNINVNAVAPGYIRTTRLTEGVPAEHLDRARELSALGRLGDPQDVAGVVLFLCSEAARHITGAVIPVDGGYRL
ncbi:MAG: 3-oxoacyl-ACP reductase FabG [Gemmatimonadetes bacterium]|nr:MAG: 3-oxoacyl-ACP reductase FabG [Gemmatimonadota bacterium]